MLIRGHGSGEWSGVGGASHSWTAGQWYHVAVTYDTSLGGRVYVNGVLDGQDSENRAIAVNSLDLFINADPFEVGWHPQVKYFPGAIDDVRVYGRALSAGEIAQLAQGPICGNTVVEPPEQCDPSQGNSPQCTQSTSWCSGPTLCVRDAYGDCTSQCACSYDAGSCSCQAGQCGAQCGPPQPNSAQCPQSTSWCSGLTLCTRDAYGDCTSGCACSSDAGSCGCQVGQCGAQCATSANCSPGWTCTGCICVAPTPGPAVGGIMERPDVASLPVQTADSGRSNTPYIAGAAAGVLVIMTAGVWYARRRRVT